MSEMSSDYEYSRPASESEYNWRPLPLQYIACNCNLFIIPIAVGPVPADASGEMVRELLLGSPAGRLG